MSVVAIGWRIDNSLRYIAGSVVSCCAECNGTKSDLEQRAFLEHIQHVIRHVGRSS